MPITITIHLAPYGSIDYKTCNTLYKVATWVTFIGISISESILLLRTSALYSMSKRVIIPLSLAYVVSAVAGTVITWSYLHPMLFGPPPSPIFTGCYVSRRNPIIFFDFLLLLIFELAVVILTVRKGYRDFHSGAPLLRVIYRDSIAFFFALFVFTLSCILVLALAPPQYGGLMAASIRVIHSIVCSRILLNLKRVVGSRNNSTAMSTGLAFATSPGQQTNQADTIALGVHGTRGDDEDPCRRADGDFVME